MRVSKTQRSRRSKQTKGKAEGLPNYYLFQDTHVSMLVAQHGDDFHDAAWIGHGGPNWSWCESASE